MTLHHSPSPSFRRALACTLAVGALLAGCAQPPQVERLVTINGTSYADSADALYAKGKEHLSAGRLGLAAQTLQMAHSRNPDSVPVLNALGVTYDGMGRYDLSDRMYRKALMRAPDDPMTLNNLGWSRTLRGRRDVGAYYIRQAAQLAPDDPAIRDNLAYLAETQPPGGAEVAVGSVPPAPSQPSRTMPPADDTPATPQRLLMVDAGAGQDRAPPLPRVETRSMTTAYLITTAPATPQRRAPTSLAPGQLATVPEAPPPPPRQKPMPEVPHVPEATVAPPEASATPPGLIMASALAVPAGGDSPAVHPAARIEVSNGVGRRHMARRTAAFLGRHGIDVGRLTNAAGFDRSTTMISLRDEAFRGLARTIAASLPITPKVMFVPGQRADLRLVIGADLTSFDANLLASRVHD